MLVLASILALCAAAPADSTCPMINQRDQGLDVLPKYPLDPEKFITPIYIWGPSSQLQVNFEDKNNMFILFKEQRGPQRATNALEFYFCFNLAGKMTN